jgi:hypothetical protein
MNRGAATSAVGQQRGVRTAFALPDNVRAEPVLRRYHT